MRLLVRSLKFILFGYIAFFIVAATPVLLAQNSTNTLPEQAELAMKKFQLAPGLKIDLFAAEPQLENPVSFSIDEHGRFFIAETHRYKSSIFDITQNQPWLLSDLSFRTVADRTAFLTKTFETNLSVMTHDSELVRLVEDRASTGRADTSSIFADGFNQIPSGVAAGILARKGEVWLACIPDFWHFTGVDSSGKAKTAEKLFTGFGVHIGVTGHDLHGLRMGPDGKIYMSSGDRGFVVTNREGKLLNNPDTGAVLRCNPDGSNLEIVCTGLRNPQELAFDQYGNLFTDDNDTAGEDRSRVVYIVEGADYGWRCSYQHMTNFGPWNTEKVWMGNIDDALPWSGYVSQGPSGLTYYPGTGLPEKYDNHFLVCDFPGGVRSFAVKPKGASYETVDNEKFLWNLWPTDVDFGPDSSVYVSDWVGGWQMPNKGRLYRITDPNSTATPAVLEVKKFLGEGFENKSSDELTTLLSHRDMRVRLESQYALAAKGGVSIAAFAKVLNQSQNQFAKLHAIWGLGQVGRTTPAAFDSVIPALHSADTELRAQAAKVLGDGHYEPALDELLQMLTGTKAYDHTPTSTDTQSAALLEPKPRFYAAVALGKLKDKKALGPITEMLRANDDRDPYLTHAGVMTLLGVGDLDAIRKLAKDKSPAVRRAAMLCFRRLESPEITQFFRDSNPRIVVETARAINDVPINAAMPQLAAMLGTEHRALWNSETITNEWNADVPVGKSTNSPTNWRHTLPYEQLLLRAINANFRLGQPENARAVVAFASRPDSPEGMRVAALDSLMRWSQPSQIDHLMGLWRPLPARDLHIAQNAVRPFVSQLLTTSHEPVLLASIRCIASLNLTNYSPTLLEMYQKAGTTPTVRIELLQALADLKDPHLEKSLELALTDANVGLRRQGMKLIASVDLAGAPKMLEHSLAVEKDIRLRQTALTALGQSKNPDADDVLLRLLAQLFAKKIAPELQLDLLEAAAVHTNPTVQTALRKYADNQSKDDEFAGYREVLLGGDAEIGSKIFNERAGVECTRCHSLRGKGGAVGPDLAGIGKRESREYLLESILYPNKKIAPGFENVTLVLKDGQTLAGVVKKEAADSLTLNITEDNTTQKILKKEIKTRQRGLSAMPEGLGAMLSKQDLRNLVEFLASLTDAHPPAKRRARE